MPKAKLALKRLTASDLTLFEWHFRNRNAGNQKAINLNRNVFVDALYPALPDAAVEHEGRLPLDLTIIGPGGKGEVNLQRKIIKFGAYKNWRLNGEFIYNPEEDPDRFNELRPDDVALFEFVGRVVPASARMVLVGKNYAYDTALYTALDGLLGESKMLPLSAEQLTRLVDGGSVPLQHPVRLLAIDEVLEDAAQGGAVGLEKLWKGIGRQRLSQEALQRARRNAEDIGRMGEELVAAYFERQLEQGRIGSYHWASNENAVAPYDFKVSIEEEHRLIDVKSTTGGFDRKLHISINELRQIADGEERYDLWRLYELNEVRAKVRVAENVREVCAVVVKAVKKLPVGVLPDSFSVDPAYFQFGEDFIIDTFDES